MPNQDQKDNQGAIWGNKKKKKDTHPDFTGNAVIGGVEYWVSAWKRSPDGNPAAPSLKFSFTKKEEPNHEDDIGI